MLEARLNALQETGSIEPEVLLKDPYLLDFLNLNDRYLEKDLEDAILLRDMEQFLLELGKSGIHVADYLTSLPPRELLEARFQQAINNARQRLANKTSESSS
ncbi:MULTISPECIES: PDDEXK nuclease domain-containing protein [unclassified Endozoicomonas]|uniref:PDDEXK nuclease domain-containing protein n=1 Tax=unclassified Endozoicomonas TaxID=2644528 RepID=UPI003BB5482D